jgi:hypothetical protein
VKEISGGLPVFQRSDAEITFLFFLQRLFRFILWLSSNSSLRVSPVRGSKDIKPNNAIMS